MNHRYTFCALLTTLAMSATGTARANDDPSAPIGLFAVTCVDLLDQPDRFEEVMNTRGDRADGAVASSFLGHEPGKAWHVTFEGVDYGFSWSTAGTCRITIFGGDAKGLRAEFQDLGKMPPDGYTSTAGATSIDEKGWAVHTYTWQKAGEDRAIQMRLSLDPKSGAHPAGTVIARHVPVTR